MHDRNGTTIKQGDKVMVLATVAETYATDEYCSVQLRTVEPMYPSANLSAVTLNSRQVVLVETAPALVTQ